MSETLRELNLDRLTCADLATPSDAVGKTSAFTRKRRNQLAGHRVVRLIVDQCLVEPLGDLRPASGDKPGSGIVVSQLIVPKRQPMLGVLDIPIEQRTDQFQMFVCRRIGKERLGLLGGWQKSDQIQVQTPDKNLVLNRSERSERPSSAVGIEDTIDRMGTIGRTRSRKLGSPRQQWWLVTLCPKRKTLFPWQSSPDPLLDGSDLQFAQARTLRGHPQIGILGRHPGEQLAGGLVFAEHLGPGFPSREHRLSRVERQATFLLIPRVTLGAVLLEHR